MSDTCLLWIGLACFAFGVILWWVQIEWEHRSFKRYAELLAEDGQKEAERSITKRIDEDTLSKLVDEGKKGES